MADDSILTKTKKVLGIEEDYEVFDIDVIMHINSVFGRLVQLGIGPEEGFMIEDKTTQWVDYLQNKLYLNSVKSYMYMRVRILFDPPATSFAIAALNDQIKEEEFRLSLYAPKATYGSETPATPATPTPTSTQTWDMTGLTEFPVAAKVGDIGIDYVTGDVWKKV